MKDEPNPTVTIAKTIFLAAAPDAVWEHLTNADKLGIWFHRADADLVDGRDYQLLSEAGDAICWGRVTQMEPPRRLAYTFTVKPLGGVMTNVEWTLDAVAGGTRLSLVHAGLPEGEEAFSLITALDAGWDAHLGRLRTA